MLKTPVGLFAHPSLRSTIESLAKEYAITTSKDVPGVIDLITIPINDEYNLFNTWLDKSSLVIEDYPGQFQADIGMARFHFNAVLIRPSWREILLYTAT